MEVLLGVSPPSTKTKIEGLTFFDDSLNTSQRDAVRFALESPEFSCIHGPPGTFLARSLSVPASPRILTRDGKDAHPHRNHPAADIHDAGESEAAAPARVRRIESCGRQHSPTASRPLACEEGQGWAAARDTCGPSCTGDGECGFTGRDTRGAGGAV